MREAFAHEAVLAMGPDADTRAPGAAVTVELCGSWEHEPPCPLAPHHATALRAGPDVRVRVVFVSEPEREGIVRVRIDRALRRGRLLGPDGVTTTWRLRTSTVGVVGDDERDRARRLMRD